jgi:hypothetical protein
MAKQRLLLPLSLVILLAASFLLIIEPSDAQSVATPSVPEFTLKIRDEIDGGGFEIKIQNQPVIPNGHDSADIFYGYRFINGMNQQAGIIVSQTQPSGSVNTSLK